MNGTKFKDRSDAGRALAGFSAGLSAASARTTGAGALPQPNSRLIFS